MINQIKKLSEYTNISGSEHDLAEYLVETLDSKGVESYVDPLGSVVVYKKGIGATPKTVMICAGMDVSGFLCLHWEKGIGSLAHTAKRAPTDCTEKSVLSSSGKTYTLKESNDQSKTFFVRSRSNVFGEAFRFKTEFSMNKSVIFGRYAAKYTILSLLISMCELNFQNNLILCFTSQSETRANGEKNVVLREKPDDVIFLATHNSKAKYPLIAEKDGKQFSSSEMIAIAKECCPKAESVVLEEGATNAHTVAPCNGFTRVLSLLIPSENCNSEHESLKLLTIRRTKKLLLELIDRF